MKGYTYFQSIVKDIYYEYVDKLIQICKMKCLDEISCSQLLYWEVIMK